ncbi:CpsD/CapB family tyrosine-protein kinase [Peribacillus simplex]|uniref:CpsD/CapB family tyrosine-protein kinase n=1 Tax=Peribacillus TaxID=2675229 RepID=UPI00295590E1|nr:MULTISPECIES: CpsD/CapB family tyrosine-protein kinase [Peribacillus]MDV7764428.1 CpsD/CapB family tyrosine-protein kinase [Peribacillus sp. CSMR9]MDW7613446.1 CpsD/CapB family tyrosine-protein kinase [Peribacillus simplex]
MSIKFTRKQSFYLNEINKEQFYSICNNIESNLQKDDSILMITSISQSQNIANATAYLALAFSEQRKRVLVVDANLRQPSLHQVFNIDNSFGLTNLLLNEKPNINDHAIHIKGHLFCIPTSEVIYEPATLLTLETLPTLIEEWKKSFDIILFHTSDSLNKPDANIVAKYCDGIILAIQEGRDKLEKIASVKMQFERANLEISGSMIIS